MKLDKSPSQIRNPKPQIGLRPELKPTSHLRFRISDLRWAFVQFKIPLYGETSSRNHSVGISRPRPISRALFNTVIKTITIFLVGPALYPALAIADVRRTRGKGQLVITNWIVMKPRAILWYVAQQIVVILLLLFISYQMKLQNVI